MTECGVAGRPLSTRLPEPSVAADHTPSPPFPEVAVSEVGTIGWEAVGCEPEGAGDEGEEVRAAEACGEGADDGKTKVKTVGAADCGAV
jgi:hypothetical protein